MKAKKAPPKKSVLKKAAGKVVHDEILPGEKDVAQSPKRHVKLDKKNSMPIDMKAGKVKEVSRNFSPASGMRQRHGESH